MELLSIYMGPTQVFEFFLDGWKNHGKSLLEDRWFHFCSTPIKKGESLPEFLENKLESVLLRTCDPNKLICVKPRLVNLLLMLVKGTSFANFPPFQQLLSEFSNS